MRTLDQIADEVHAVARNSGWHDDGLTNDQFLTVQLNNIVAEVSELWEAYRNGELHQLCDKAKKMHEAGIPPLTCIEEEYADIIIRALDQCRRLGVNISRAIEIKSVFNGTRAHRHGGKLA